MYIVTGKRTPFGCFLGAYKNTSANKLASFLVEKICDQSDLVPSAIAVGCTLQAGLGQAFAKNLLLSTKEPMNIPAITLNKVCGSGFAAVSYGVKSMKCEPHLKVFLCGGVDNMSKAPFLLDARAGFKMGSQEIKDHMVYDGLLDYSTSKTMGELAENLADKHQISRAEQEAYVTKSFEDYIHNKEKIYEDILAYKENDETILAEDEIPLKVKISKFSTLKPSFKENGTITAATSSALSDGAAFLLLSYDRISDSCAKILGISEYSGHPISFAEAPIFAVTKLLKKLDLKIEDIKLFEINEAFAVVPIAFMNAFSLPRNKMNIFGGACIVGHPLGASGIRIILNLKNALRHIGGGIGIAALCIGGGEAMAIAIEV